MKEEQKQLAMTRNAGQPGLIPMILAQTARAPPKLPPKQRPPIASPKVCR